MNEQVKNELENAARLLEMTNDETQAKWNNIVNDC